MTMLTGPISSVRKTSADGAPRVLAHRDAGGKPGGLAHGTHRHQELILHYRLFVSIVFGLMTACSSESDNTLSPIKVEIEKTESGYRLLRGGEPYTVRGAGMGRDDIERFTAAGGNSIRNWSTMQRGQDTDEARASRFRLRRRGRRRCPAGVDARGSTQVPRPSRRPGLGYWQRTQP